MQSDAVALDYAQAYTASRAETSVRCDSIELDLYTPNYNSGILAALELDFFDPIRVVTTQPGGSTLDKTLANLWRIKTSSHPTALGWFLQL
jgi:hypothetical protein